MTLYGWEDSSENGWIGVASITTPIVQILLVDPNQIPGTKKLFF
jgi:hypothetical protein